METLLMLGSCDSILGRRPDRLLIPDREASCGSPGHGVRYRCSASSRFDLLAEVFCGSGRSLNVVR